MTRRIRRIGTSSSRSCAASERVEISLSDDERRSPCGSMAGDGAHERLRQARPLRRSALRSEELALHGDRARRRVPRESRQLPGLLQPRYEPGCGAAPCRDELSDVARSAGLARSCLFATDEPYVRCHRPRWRRGRELALLPVLRARHDRGDPRLGIEKRHRHPVRHPLGRATRDPVRCRHRDAERPHAHARRKHRPRCFHLRPRGHGDTR